MSHPTLLALATTAALGCGGPGAEPKTPAANGPMPPLRVVVREGDPAPAVAAFLSTAGIEPGSGAAPAVALAAVIEARLAGVDARVVPQYDGVRVDLLGAKADLLMKAMFDPIAPNELEPVKRKLDALARLSPLDSELSSCTGDLARGKPLDPSIAESVRAQTIGIGRVGLAVVGRSKAVEEARAAFRARPWPARTLAPRPPAPAFAAVEMPGPPRALVFARARSAVASAAAERLAHAHVPLDGVHAITCVLHPESACVALDVDADPNAIALAKLALADALRNDGSDEIESARSIASAGDVRDAAARAAIWAFANKAPTSALSVHVTGSELAGLESALARSEADLSKPVLETSTQTEPGTGSVWVLVASPCGTESEGSSDAGSSALFATSVAKSTDDVTLEPWVAPDGVGLLAHAVRPISDERVGEVLGRALFRGEPMVARSELVKLATNPLGVLGTALAPGHPTWIVPAGTPDALLRMSDETVATRAAALRAGPWRAVVITDRPANDVAIDRWIPRSGTRTCPTGSPRTLPSPGTYAASSSSSEAYLAFPLDPAQLPAAPILVAALEDLLSKSLAGTIRSASARLLGAPRAPAIVAHLDAPSSALDGAVLQARVLFERLRKSGLAPDELARAKKAQAAADLHARLDPRERLIRRWRNAPQTSIDDAGIQAAASAIFHDDALVVVAARPGGKP